MTDNSSTPNSRERATFNRVGAFSLMFELSLPAGCLIAKAAAIAVAVCRGDPTPEPGMLAPPTRPGSVHDPHDPTTEL